MVPTLHRVNVMMTTTTISTRAAPIRRKKPEEFCNVSYPDPSEFSIGKILEEEKVAAVTESVEAVVRTFKHQVQENLSTLGEAQHGLDQRQIGFDKALEQFSLQLRRYAGAQLNLHSGSQAKVLEASNDLVERLESNAAEINADLLPNLAAKFIQAERKLPRHDRLSTRDSPHKSHYPKLHALLTKYGPSHHHHHHHHNHGHRPTSTLPLVETTTATPNDVVGIPKLLSSKSRTSSSLASAATPDLTPLSPENDLPTTTTNPQHCPTAIDTLRKFKPL